MPKNGGFKVNDLPDFLRDDVAQQHVEEVRGPQTERHLPNKDKIADPATAFLDNMKNMVQNAFSEVSSAFTQT